MRVEISIVSHRGKFLFAFFRVYASCQNQTLWLSRYEEQAFRILLYGNFNPDGAAKLAMYFVPTMVCGFIAIFLCNNRVDFKSCLIYQMLFSYFNARFTSTYRLT